MATVLCFYQLAAITTISDLTPGTARMHWRHLNVVADYFILPSYLLREKELAVALQRLIDAKYPLTGASDHGVSEAIYLNDPDGNGVELYWDRPREQWPFDSNGNLLMGTNALDIQGLLREI